MEATCAGRSAIMSAIASEKARARAIAFAVGPWQVRRSGRSGQGAGIVRGGKALKRPASVAMAPRREGRRHPRRR